MGDKKGHPFRGNQWTTGGGGVVGRGGGSTQYLRTIGFLNAHGKPTAASVEYRNNPRMRDPRTGLPSALGRRLINQSTAAVTSRKSGALATISLSNVKRAAQSPGIYKKATGKRGKSAAMSTPSRPSGYAGIVSLSKVYGYRVKKK